MFKTPLGNIKIFLDDEEVNFEARKIENNFFCRGCECFLISVPIHNNKKIVLSLDSDTTGDSEGGESLASLRYEKNGIQMNISTIDYEDQLDVKVSSIYVSNNQIINERLELVSQVYFCIAWQYCDDSDDATTWFASDALLYIDNRAYFHEIYERLKVIESIKLDD